MSKSRKCTAHYSKCSNTILRKYQQNKHLGKYSCHRCRKLFKSRKYILDHFRKIHKRGITICSMCKKYFYRIEWLYEHERKCETRLDTYDKQMICDVCNEKYFSHEFPNHILSHLGVTSYYCELCCKHCLSKTELEEHDMIHKQLSNSTQSSSLTHTCDLCSLVFNNLIDLSYHYASHIKRMPYFCNICNTSFNDENDSIIHSHLHKTGKIRCNLCKVKFENKLECLLHVVTHNTSKFFCNFFYITREDIFKRNNLHKIITFYYYGGVIKSKDDLKDFFNNLEYDFKAFHSNSVISSSVNDLSIDSVSKKHTKTTMEENGLIDNIKLHSNKEFYTTSSKISSLDNEAFLINSLNYLIEQNNDSNVRNKNTDNLDTETKKSLLSSELKERNIADLNIKIEPISCSNIQEAWADSDNKNSFCNKDFESNNPCILSSVSSFNQKLFKNEIICETEKIDTCSEKLENRISVLNENKHSYLPLDEITSKNLKYEDSFSEILQKRAVVKLHRLPQDIYNTFLQKTPVVIEKNVYFQNKSIDGHSNFQNSIFCSNPQTSFALKHRHNETAPVNLPNRRFAYKKAVESVHQKSNSTILPSFSVANVSLNHRRNEAPTNYSSLMCSPKLLSLENALNTRCNGKCERNIYGKPMCSHMLDKVLITTLFGLKTIDTPSTSPSNRVLTKNPLANVKSACSGKSQPIIIKNEAIKQKNHLDRTKYFLRSNITPGQKKIPEGHKVASISTSSLHGVNSKLSLSSTNGFVKSVAFSGNKSLGIIHQNNIMNNCSNINASKNVKGDHLRPDLKFILKKHCKPSLVPISVADGRHLIHPSTLPRSKISTKLETYADLIVDKKLEETKLINNTHGSGLPRIETVGSVISFDAGKTNENKRSYQIYTPAMERIPKKHISSMLSQKSNSIHSDPSVKAIVKLKIPSVLQSKMKSPVQVAQSRKGSTCPTVLYTLIKRPYESSLKLENVEKMRDIKGLLK